MQEENKREKQPAQNESAEQEEIFDATAFATALEDEPRAAHEKAVSAEEYAALSLERQAQVDELEGEYLQKADAIEEQGAKERGLLVKGVSKAAEILDLDSKEKVATALIELVPFVGLGYAVAGKRLEIKKDGETGKRSVELTDISGFERVIYLAGELMGSGHVMRGVVNKIKQQGIKVFAKHAAKETAKRGARMLVARGKEGAKRELKKKLKGE